VILHTLEKHDWPDATNGIPCCMGYAAMGPGNCTCWEPVYDLEQQAFGGDPLPGLAAKACSDCAYRKGSPERIGTPGYFGDKDSLEEWVETGQTFWCHQGMRRIIKWRHPSGMEIPAHPASYRPGIVGEGNDRKPLKADGTVADICGGYCAKRLGTIRKRETVEPEDLTDFMGRA
jgi:hypothetical protein